GNQTSIKFNYRIVNLILSYEVQLRASEKRNPSESIGSEIVLRNTPHSVSVKILEYFASRSVSTTEYRSPKFYLIVVYYPNIPNAIAASSSFNPIYGNRFEIRKPVKRNSQSCSVEIP